MLHLCLLECSKGMMVGHNKRVQLQNSISFIAECPPQKMIYRYQYTKLQAALTFAFVTATLEHSVQSMYQYCLNITLLQSTLAGLRSCPALRCTHHLQGLPCPLPSTDLCNGDQTASPSGPTVLTRPPQETPFNVTRHRC